MPFRRIPSAATAALICTDSCRSDSCIAAICAQPGRPSRRHTLGRASAPAGTTQLSVLQQRKRKRSAMTHHPRALQHGQLEEHRDRPKSRLRPVIARAILEADRQPQNTARTLTEVVSEVQR